MTADSDALARTGGAASARRRAQSVAGPVAVYLAGQLLALSMLAALGRAQGKGLLDRLTAWDGLHFLAIAEHGYLWSTVPGTERSPAFLPGYPMAISAVHAITRLPYTGAALAISWVSGAFFACAVARIVRHLRGTNRQTEYLAVALVAVSPLSIVLAMAYSEALFCALASWALVAALERRWYAAAALGWLAGLVRISGLALTAALAMVAVVALVRALRHRKTWGTALGEAIGPGLAAIATAAGTSGWIVGSGLAMGSPTAWFAAQNQGWDSHWDFGAASLQFLYRMATTGPNVYEPAVAILMIASVVLVLCSIEQRQPLVLLVYGIAAVAEVLGSAGLMNSKARLLIPAFTILLPVAAWLGRLRTAHAIGAVIAIGLLGSWLGAYGLTIWQYAI